MSGAARPWRTASTRGPGARPGGPPPGWAGKAAKAPPAGPGHSFTSHINLSPFFVTETTRRILQNVLKLS